MSHNSQALSLWRSLSGWPGGRWLFSTIITYRAPYFATIRPRFTELRPGYCELTLRKRRRVHNHIGTVHAIAMCNMAELAGGLATDVTIPAGYRWIPKGMTVRYLAKAQTDLTAIAELGALPEFNKPTDLIVPVRILDTADNRVFEADITMWISPRNDR